MSGMINIGISTHSILQDPNSEIVDGRSCGSPGVQQPIEGGDGTRVAMT